MTPQQRNERTQVLLSRLQTAPHQTLLDWAHHHRESWELHMKRQPQGSEHWHVAKIEIAYWNTLISMLKVGVLA